MGLQLLARPFDEAALFRVGFAYEQATLHRQASAIFPELQPSLQASPAAGPVLSSG